MSLTHDFRLAHSKTVEVEI